MRGFVTDPGGRAGLRWADDLPEPEPKPDQALVVVRALRGKAVLTLTRPA